MEHSPELEEGVIAGNALFQRKNILATSNAPIQVTDVAEHIGRSRSYLSGRF